MNLKPVEVELIWIRHGESCSNLISPILSEYSEFINKKKVIRHIKNSHLSNFGISHIHSIKEKSDFYQDLNPDLIVCSQLIRTIETAYLLFYDKLRSGNRNSLLSKFFISPFISEFISLKMYETPHSPTDTLSRFHQFQSYLADTNLYPIKEIHLNYIRKDPSPKQNNAFKNASSINAKTWIDYYFKASSDHDNYDLFISKILPLLIQKVISKEPEKRKIKIAIICHANYIERHVLKTLRYNEISPGKYEKVNENTIDPNVYIFNSPPKNGDAYLEKYIFNYNSLEREPARIVEQIFPERIKSIMFLPSGPIPKDSMIIPQFDKYDKFKFLFYPELGDIQFDIKNRMNVTRILQLIRSKMNNNKEYEKLLNNNNSDLWKKILGLCYIEELVPYYKTDYNRRPKLIQNSKNTIEGKKNVKRKSKKNHMKKL